MPGILMLALKWKLWRTKQQRTGTMLLFAIGMMVALVGHAASYRKA